MSGDDLDSDYDPEMPSLVRFLLGVEREFPEDPDLEAAFVTYTTTDGAVGHLSHPPRSVPTRDSLALAAVCRSFAEWLVVYERERWADQAEAAHERGGASRPHPARWAATGGMYQ